MYSFKDKIINVNYVLDIRSTFITKNALNLYSMVHAGISGIFPGQSIIQLWPHGHIKMVKPLNGILYPETYTQS